MSSIVTVFIIFYLSLDKVLCETLHEGQDEEVSVSYQSQGVAPSELDKKLCHLLIEQQENQIVGLESELNGAQSKLREKETELQALKDYVRRLTEFSISTESHNETNVKADQEVLARVSNKREPETSANFLFISWEMSSGFRLDHSVEQASLYVDHLLEESFAEVRKLRSYMYSYKAN